MTDEYGVSSLDEIQGVFQGIKQNIFVGLVIDSAQFGYFQFCVTYS